VKTALLIPVWILLLLGPFALAVLLLKLKDRSPERYQSVRRIISHTQRVLGGVALVLGGAYCFLTGRWWMAVVFLFVVWLTWPLKQPNHDGFPPPEPPTEGSPRPAPLIPSSPLIQAARAELPDDPKG
jgi:hypothetical protein